MGVLLATCNVGTKLVRRRDEIEKSGGRGKNQCCFCAQKRFPAKPLASENIFLNKKRFHYVFEPTRVLVDNKPW